MDLLKAAPPRRNGSVNYWFWHSFGNIFHFLLLFHKCVVCGQVMAPCFFLVRVLLPCDNPVPHSLIQCFLYIFISSSCMCFTHYWLRIFIKNLDTNTVTISSPYSGCLIAYESDHLQCHFDTHFHYSQYPFSVKPISSLCSEKYYP